MRTKRLITARALGAVTVAVALVLGGLTLWTGPALAQQQPVLIGATIAQSGALARAAKAQLTAYQLAEEITNQEGGLLGRPVKLVLYDDQSNASNGVTLYRRLIFQDKVDLLLGPFSSAVTFAIAPIIEQAKIPLLAPQAADPKIWEGGRRYVFQVLPHGYSYLSGVADLAVKHGLKKAAVVSLESAFPIAAAARALMTDPRLLLLDEPSLGLAPMVVNEMFAALDVITRAGTAILIVEQNAAKALAHSSRAYVLESGRITLEGPSGALASRPDIRSAYLGGEA